jgi:putative protease
VAEIKLETGDLEVSDEILVIGPTTGVIELKISELRVELNAVKSASKGSVCSIPVKDIVRRSDKVYRWVDASEVKKQ